MTVTSMLDAEPVLVAVLPEDWLWPFLETLAMTLFFVALLSSWYFAVGIMAVA